MRLMQFAALGRYLPRSLRVRLRRRWNQLLELEKFFQERRFYREFIGPDDLVFDIGANKGGKTAAFLSLGSRVVAAEANPICVAAMRRRFEKPITEHRLCVEATAVADEVGEVTFTLFD